MTQVDFDIWQEYAAMMSPSRIHTPEELRRNLEKDRHQRRINTTRHLPTPLEKYELRVAEIAERQCKTPAEWRKDDAEDMRHLASGEMWHKSAGECLERYEMKMQGIYRFWGRYKNQTAACEQMIAELEQLVAELTPTNRKKALQSAQNKLGHWRGRKLDLQRLLVRHRPKERRYERLTMKWRGINEKIKVADIARQIWDERRGIGNKYGFNPKAQDRETAEIMFQD